MRKSIRSWSQYQLIGQMKEDEAPAKMQELEELLGKLLKTYEKKLAELRKKALKDLANARKKVEEEKDEWLDFKGFYDELMAELGDAEALLGSADPDLVNQAALAINLVYSRAALAGSGSKSGSGEKLGEGFDDVQKKRNELSAKLKETAARLPDTHAELLARLKDVLTRAARFGRRGDGGIEALGGRHRQGRRASEARRGTVSAVQRTGQEGAQAKSARSRKRRGLRAAVGVPGEPGRALRRRGSALETRRRTDAGARTAGHDPSRTRRSRRRARSGPGRGRQEPRGGARQGRNEAARRTVDHRPRRVPENDNSRHRRSDDQESRQSRRSHLYQGHEGPRRPAQHGGQTVLQAGQGDSRHRRRPQGVRRGVSRPSRMPRAADRLATDPLGTNVQQNGDVKRLAKWGTRVEAFKKAATELQNTFRTAASEGPTTPPQTDEQEVLKLKQKLNAAAETACNRIDDAVHFFDEVGAATPRAGAGAEQPQRPAGGTPQGARRILRTVRDATKDLLADPVLAALRGKIPAPGKSLLPALGGLNAGLKILEIEALVGT